MFPYKWYLKDAVFTKDKGRVFSCFACGGGSTMGYKLAGFDVIGCCEIDPQMNKSYVKNHNPKYNFLEPIQQFKLRDDLPEELFHLDILDGSPPCSSFSLSGNRDEDWGKEKKFKEGQADQILDTLFFDWIDLVKRLKPKVAMGENVPGILMGDAIEYVRTIYEMMDDAGYYLQHWTIDCARTGVPQRRQRVFFIALRKDLAAPFMKPVDLFTEKPELILDFREKDIPFGQVRSPLFEGKTKETERFKLMAHRIESDRTIDDINQRLFNKTSGFNSMILHDNEICPTITAGEKNFRHCDGLYCSDHDYAICSTFPLDYDYCSDADGACKYITGMSVPPVAVARIATEIYSQWLAKIN